MRVNIKSIDIYRDGRQQHIKTKVFLNGSLEDVDKIEFNKPAKLIVNEIGAYTTWYADPSNSVMLHYLTVGNTFAECQVRVLGTYEWYTVPLFADKIFPLNTKRVKWFKVENLTPDTTYETRLKGSDNIYKFKTMPATHTRDIKIALISDHMGFQAMPDVEKSFIAEATQQFRTMHNNNVDVICLAGDGVHDNGTRGDYWEEFWGEYFKSCDNNNNLMIPILYCFGNHDGIHYREDGRRVFLWHYEGSTKDSVVFQYNFFSNLNDLGYGAIDIGDYMSILYMNSDHTQPIIGDQVTWLENTLQARQGRHIFPFFHVTPYPLYYAYSEGYSGAQAKQIRENWSPLFSQYGVKVAGCGHDHTSSVTKKVTNDSLDETNGVVYTGQGYCAGSETRTFDGRDLWYSDYHSFDVKGFSIISFKNNGSVDLKRVSLDGTSLYSKTI